METIAAPIPEVKGRSISQLRRRAAQYGFRFNKLPKRSGSISGHGDLTLRLFRFQRKRITHQHNHLTVVERAAVRNVSLADVEDLCGLLDKTMLHWHATRERCAQ